MNTPMRRLMPALLLALIVACTERAPVAQEAPPPTAAAQDAAANAVAKPATPYVAGSLPNFAGLVGASVELARSNVLGALWWNARQLLRVDLLL